MARREKRCATELSPASSIRSRRDSLSRKPTSEIDPAPEMVVLIDGAHIRAAYGYQSRHIDVTVGKVEVAGKRSRRFALAPKRAESPQRLRIDPGPCQ